MNASPSSFAQLWEGTLDPFPLYRSLRTSMPVATMGPAVSVFCYADVQRVLSEYATFSSQYGRQPGAEADHPFGASIISTDPPRHKQLRGLVSQAFTPRTISQLAPRITDIVRELLDGVAARGEGTMDIVDDLAYPLPVIVIAELLGIPVEDRAMFKQWSDSVVTPGQGGGRGERQAERASLHQGMQRYFQRMIAERRRAPRNDLISHLLQAQIAGQHLSEMELLGFCMLLLVAGNETTTNLIANAIMTFDEHPEVEERLRATPDLLPGAIEEVLRYRSPVQAMFRTATSDVEIRGTPIRKGQRVIAWIGSANHDEAQFSEPERFDIERSPNRHLAFGSGIHFCLGAPLARLEAEIALGAVLERFHDLRRVPDVTLEPLGGFIVYGVRHLPVRFRAA